MHLSFDGTAYHGWQIQQNAISVQQKLDEALATLLGRESGTVGCGRTDAGVHASSFFAHFDAPAMNNEELCFRLNGLLPPDIAVHSVIPVPADAHARFSALSRTYRYTVSKRKDPFRQKTALMFNAHLDIEKMNEAAAALLQQSDFSSFCKANEQAHDNHCKIFSALWTARGHLLFFDIRANRFLRNMVRALTGTLLQVGTGEIDRDGFLSIMEKKDRRAAGPSLPARGLCLTNVTYPEKLLK